jgi:hypothetical protein
VCLLFNTHFPLVIMKRSFQDVQRELAEARAHFEAKGKELAAAKAHMTALISESNVAMNQDMHAALGDTIFKQWSEWQTKARGPAVPPAKTPLTFSFAPAPAPAPPQSLALVIRAPSPLRVNALSASQGENTIVTAEAISEAAQCQYLATRNKAADRKRCAQTAILQSWSHRYGTTHFCAAHTCSACHVRKANNGAKLCSECSRADFDENATKMRALRDRASKY